MLYDRSLTLFRQYLPQAIFRSQPASDWYGRDPLQVEIATYLLQEVQHPDDAIKLRAVTRLGHLHYGNDTMIAPSRRWRKAAAPSFRTR